MKKIKLATMFLLLVGAAPDMFSQQTFFVGKYRKLFYDQDMKCDILCKKEVTIDSFTYCAIGLPIGDEFLLTGSVNGKIIMIQRFFMNGAKNNQYQQQGDWFGKKYNITLDYFLKEIFYFE